MDGLWTVSGTVHRPSTQTVVKNYTDRTDHENKGLSSVCLYKFLTVSMVCTVFYNGLWDGLWTVLGMCKNCVNVGAHLKKGSCLDFLSFLNTQNEYFRGAFGHRKRATLNPGGGGKI